MGPYELRERIGSGGMGVVYRAWHPVLRREVAVKLLRAGDGATPAEAARLAREAEAIARLNHPHIVEVFEVGEADGRPFLALEYVPGPDLRRHLADRSLSPAAAAGLIETPDGRRLAAGWWEGATSVWEAGTWRELGIIRAPEATLCLTFSPNGSALAIGNSTGTVRLWDAETLQERVAIQAHKGRVEGVAFLPDGEVMLTSGDDRTLRAWDGSRSE